MTTTINYNKATAGASSVWVLEPVKDEPKVWLNEAPTSMLGALLQAEVGHVGSCYVGRVVRSTPLAILLAAAGALAHAAGEHWRDGGVGAAVDRWSDVDPRIAVLAVAASLVLCASTVFVRHLLWHHDEAPYAGNEVLGIVREVSRG